MIAFLLALALATGAVLAFWRARRWVVGKAAPVSPLRGLLRLPRSYFHDVHDIVARDAYAARMHVMAAGGFVGAIALVLLIHLLGVAWRPLAWLALALLFLMAVGALHVLARRWPATPARLSRGAYGRLPWSLLAFALFFIWATLPVAGVAPPIDWSHPLSWPMLAVGILGMAEMIAFFPVGPMKHAFAGALHLVLHPRFERLGAAKPVSALAPLDLEAPKLGAETPADFAWNRLLGFDACVQCGRCEAACPAFAAELPLNPKALIQDLVRANGVEALDFAYAGSAHPSRPIAAGGGAVLPIVGEAAAIHPDTLWSCTTCRACVQECPMMIEHVDAIVDLRRFQALERGAVPGKAPQVLADMREADTPSGHALASRLDWAADLSIPVLAEGGSCDILLWLGEGAFELRNQRTLRSLVRLLRKAGVDFACLGAEELDSGDLARRLGDEATFQSLTTRNIATLAKRRFARIVTADPHVFHVLANEYPALGGRYRVEHHTQVLASLLAAGALQAKAKPDGRVTYHDPCYLGRYNGEIGAPRAILDAIGAERVEMERSGMRSFCCGGGGGAPVTDIAGKRRIPDVRMDQARATGASIVAVACPNCANMLEGVTGARPDVADVAELLERAVEAA
jgi:Fe-S oxidoreductase